jgi:hypothetical protein
MKVLGWVNRFKEIGDIIVQFDPVHPALPWEGFRFLLQLCSDRQETVDAQLVGLEKTAGLIDRCTVYEILYLNGDPAASRNLEKSILRLCTAILTFLAEAIKRSKGENSRRRRLSPLTLSQTTTSRQCSPPEIFPSTLMTLSARRKLLETMLRPLELNLTGRGSRSLKCCWVMST